MEMIKNPRDKLINDIGYLNPEDWKKVNRYVAKLRTLERMEAKEFNRMVEKGYADHDNRYYDETGTEELRCSFCGLHQSAVKKLVADDDVCICDECIDLCNEILMVSDWEDEPEITRFNGALNIWYEIAIQGIEKGERLCRECVNCLLPQPLGGGSSCKSARLYGIGGEAEARAYLKEDKTSKALMGICEALLKQQKDVLKKILPPPEDRTLHISMTMFHIVQPRNKTFKMVLDKFFDGKPDKSTEVLCREVWR